MKKALPVVAISLAILAGCTLLSLTGQYTAVALPHEEGAFGIYVPPKVVIVDTWTGDHRFVK